MTTGAIGMQTPVVTDPPPWSSSQRAGSFPPWSQRSAGAAPTRAATLPFWSQRSTEVASAGLSERLGDRDRPSGSPVEQMSDRQEEEGEDEEEEEEEDTVEDIGVGRMLSQLSTRQDTLHRWVVAWRLSLWDAVYWPGLQRTVDGRTNGGLVSC